MSLKVPGGSVRKGRQAQDTSAQVTNRMDIFPGLVAIGERDHDIRYMTQGFRRARLD